MEKLIFSEGSPLADLPERAQDLISSVLTIALILIAAKIIIMILRSVIRRGFDARAKRAKDDIEKNKAHTASRLVTGAVRFLVWFLAACSILDTLQLGITAGSLLATAGVGGIAIGIGAQAFIGDIVNGFMLMLENQYSIGDYIDAGGAVGTVENITLRTTSIRLDNHELAMLPNGTIRKVINHTRGDYLMFFEYKVAQNADIEKAGQIMEEAGRAYRTHHEDVVADPVFVGPSLVQPKVIQLRMTVLCKPLAKWQVERDLNEAVTDALRKGGIPLPDFESYVVVGGTK